MANFKRTYINADEELVIQGKLTIEGELEQKEFVESTSFSQTNFAGDVFVINSDGFTKDVSPTATNSELKLRSGDANASLLFNSVAGTLTLSTSPAIATTLTVSGDIAATDITASGTITGTLSGTATSAATATALASNRNFSITGDVTANAVQFDGTTDVVLNAGIDSGAVLSGMIGNDQILPVHIDATVLTTHIGEGTNLYFTATRAQNAISVNDTSTGIFLNSLTKSGGAISFSAPSDNTIRSTVIANVNGTGLAYNNTTGNLDITPVSIISATGVTTDNLTEGSTNLYATNTNIRAALSGGTGITYNSTSGVISITNSGVTAASYGSATAIPTFTVNAQGQLTAAADVNIAIPASQVTDFSEAVDDRVNALTVAGTGITKVYDDANGTLTLSTTDADIVHDNLSGFVANEHIDHSAVSIATGTGLQGGGDITATRTLSIDNTVATLTGAQTLTNKTLTSPVISQISGDVEITGNLNVVANLNSATQTDSFVTTKKLTLNVGGGATPDASRVEVDRTGTGSNVYLRWNETADRWMFSNDGSTNNNMLIESDVEGFFSAVTSGDGSLSYNNAGVFTYTGPGNSDYRGAISVTDAGGDGSLAYNNSTGVLTYTGPSLAEIQSRIDNSASNVRAHFSGGTAINLSGGTISLGTVPDTLSFTQGHVKFSNNSIGIGPSAGTFNSSEANAISIGNLAGSTTQQSATVAIGVEAGKTNQIDTSVAIGYKAGYENQGDYALSGTGTGSSVGIGTLAGYSNQGMYSIAIGESSGLVQQQEHSIAIGKKAGNLAQKAYSIAIGVEAGKTQQGDYSIALGHKAGETSQANDTIVLRAGDSTFPYPAAATAGATYISPLRNTTSDTGKVVMYNDTTYEVSRVPSTIFVSASSAQTVAGNKTFSGQVVIPNSSSSTEGAIWYSGSKAYIYAGGVAQEITPATTVGTVQTSASAGSGVSAYAGSSGSGNTTVHSIRKIDGGTNITVSESSDVITVTTDAFRSDANVRALFSAVDSAGDGALSYNAATGQFTYSGITDSQVRGKISGTGLISYDNSTGVISTTADNYGSFTVKTDTGNAGAEAISSGETLTIEGGTNITVTNTGNTVTIRNDNSADIEAVTAGAGMTGGGSAGAVTLNVIGGDGITANADDIQVDSTVVRTTGAQTIAGNKTLTGTTRIDSLGINGAYNFPTSDGTSNQVITTNGSGTLTFTDVSAIGGTITGVVAGAGMTGGGVAGTVTLNVVGGTGITANANDIAIDSTVATLTGSQTLTNKTLTSPVLNTGVSGTAIKDEDNMASDSDSHLATQQSIKAYVDSQVQSKDALSELSGNTDDVAEGSSNLYYTDARADARATLRINAATTDNISEGSSNFYFTNSRADARVDAQTGANLDLSSKSTTNLSEGSNLYFTDERVDDRVANLITAGVNVAKTYDDAAGTLEIRVPYENIQDTVGAQLVTNGSHTGITATYDDANDAAIDLAINTSHIRGLFSAGGDLSYNSSTGQFSFTNDAGDIESVGAGAGLTGGGTSGAVTLAVSLSDTAIFTSTNTASRAVVRDGSGNFAAGVITATATSARYADLAENYEADADYDVGTVVVIGGEKEITVTDQMNSTKVAGVISSDPAYLMNSEIGGEFIKPVALRGRVPVKVIGVVQKGDVLITSSTPGFAMAAAHPHNVSASELVGKALEAKTHGAEGVVEALI